MIASTTQIVIQQSTPTELGIDTLKNYLLLQQDVNTNYLARNVKVTGAALDWHQQGASSFLLMQN